MEQNNRSMNKDVLIAYAYDGMRHTYEKEVTSISVWINGKCGHQVNDESVSALLKEAKESGKMQIYICDNKLDGKYRCVWWYSTVHKWTIKRK